MALTVKCECGRQYKLKEELAGKKGRCHSCGTILEIPPKRDGSDARSDDGILGHDKRVHREITKPHKPESIAATHDANSQRADCDNDAMVDYGAIAHKALLAVAQTALRPFKFYWSRRQPLSLYIASTLSLAQAKQRRKVEAKVWDTAQDESGNLLVQLPQRCATCGVVTDRPFSEERRYVDRLFWPLLCPSLGIVISPPLFVVSLWAGLIPTLSGIFLGYALRRQTAVTIRYSRCEKHAAASKHPELRIFKNNLYVLFGSTEVKQAYLAGVEIDADRLNVSISRRSNGRIELRRYQQFFGRWRPPDTFDVTDYDSIHCWHVVAVSILRPMGVHIDYLELHGQGVEPLVLCMRARHPLATWRSRGPVQIAEMIAEVTAWPIIHHEDPGRPYFMNAKKIVPPLSMPGPSKSEQKEAGTGDPDASKPKRSSGGTLKRKERKNVS